MSRGINLNIRYTQTKKRLVDVYYSFSETKGEDVYESIDKLMSALTAEGFNCEIINNIEHSKTIQLPFIGISPDGDEMHWPNVCDEKERRFFVENYENFDLDSHDSKTIAIHY